MEGGLFFNRRVKNDCYLCTTTDNRLVKPIPHGRLYVSIETLFLITHVTKQRHNTLLNPALTLDIFDRYDHRYQAVKYRVGGNISVLEE